MAFKIKVEYIKIFIILTLLALNLAIYSNGRTLNPDNCIIEFKSAPAGHDILTMPINISIKLTELYENLENGKCRVTFDRVRGYRLG